MKEYKMTQKKHLFALATLALIVMVFLSACGGKNAEEEAVDPNAAITQVVETAMAALTQTAAVQSPTPSITPTILPTNTSIPTMQPSPTVSTLVGLPTTVSTSPSFAQPGVQTSSCDIGGFVKDVTVPDGTTVSAGQTFTKTWEIKNNGTCTWNKNYSIVFYGGTQMAKETVYSFTDKDIKPSESVQISVEMTAPTKTGKYTSYWILRNDLSQNFFVDGSSIYVEIVVGTASTATPTTSVPSATPNPWPTLNFTSAPTSGSVNIALSFSATATDVKDGTISDNISWTTSDGQTDTGATVSFTFTTAGTFTITASITDSDLNTTTKQVNVTIN